MPPKGFWVRGGSVRRTGQFWDEAPVMMIVVLAARLFFCWIELTSWARLRRDNDNNENV